MKKRLLPLVLCLLLCSPVLANPKKPPQSPQRPVSARFLPLTVTNFWARIGSLFRRVRPLCDTHTQPPPCPGVPGSGG
jgi:hypothetical protein